MHLSLCVISELRQLKFYMIITFLIRLTILTSTGTLFAPPGAITANPRCDVLVIPHRNPSITTVIIAPFMVFQPQVSTYIFARCFHISRNLAVHF